SLVLQRHRSIGAMNAREARTGNLRDARDRVADNCVVDPPEASASGANVNGIDREAHGAKHLKAALLRLLLVVVHEVAPVVRFRRLGCFKTCRCQLKARSSRPSRAACSRSCKSLPLAFHSLTSTARTQSLHAASSST